MKNSTYYGEIQTPVPGDDWKSLSDIERKYLVLSKLEYASFNFLSYIPANRELLFYFNNLKIFFYFFNKYISFDIVNIF